MKQDVCNNSTNIRIIFLLYKKEKKLLFVYRANRSITGTSTKEKHLGVNVFNFKKDRLPLGRHNLCFLNLKNNYIFEATKKLSLPSLY